ncbi:hypothetical protein B0G69_6507 [Paraburkholderia sp. RAU2J]|uniref:hypothetical protein n=1 Tax=Paraburkholderia sp. RAU2J TaxID=1938810 RepID=UPI000F1CEEE8|nr:hypothetical protein [Paraburkholderia sp. RAU2J]RKT13366.1 hypothetical protein B0G69_6507 [Paraburkholderia sp. RAU2J]
MSERDWHIRMARTFLGAGHARSPVSTALFMARQTRDVSRKTPPEGRGYHADIPAIDPAAPARGEFFQET